MFKLKEDLMRARVFRLGLVTIMVGLMGFASQASAADFKIGFVNIQKAITETKEFKKSQMKFQVKLKKEKGIIDARKKKVENMLRELNKQGFVLNPELKKAKEESFLREKKEFERYVQDREEEFGRSEKKVIEKISKKMLEVLKQLGKQKKLTMVIEKKAVFYSDSALDLTNLAVKTYDRLYP